MDSDPIGKIVSRNLKQQQNKKKFIVLAIVLVLLFGFIGMWFSDFFSPQEPLFVLCQIHWPQRSKKTLFKLSLKHLQKKKLPFSVVYDDLQNMNVLLTIKDKTGKLQFGGKANQPLKVIYKDLEILVYIDAPKNALSQKKLNIGYKEAKQEMYRLAKKLTSNQKPNLAIEKTFISLYENVYTAPPNATNIKYFQFIPNSSFLNLKITQ